jgi:hypothetical protein
MDERSFTVGVCACALAMVACSKDRATAQETPTPASSVSVVVPPTPIPTFAAPPEVGAPPADATKTPSGLAFKILKPGTGQDHPRATDRVNLYYVGWTKRGQMFDSNVAPLGPITLRVNSVIAGWREALELMVIGEKRRLWIPAPLAYGDDAHAGRPSGDLVFDVELVDILTSARPPSPMP